MRQSIVRRDGSGRLGDQKRQRLREHSQYNQRALTTTATATATQPTHIYPMTFIATMGIRKAQSGIKYRKIWWIGYYRRSWLEEVGIHEMLQGYQQECLVLIQKRRKKNDDRGWE